MVCGWARTIRGTAVDKGPVFVELNDGSTILNIQVVCELPTMSKDDIEAILKAGKNY